MLDVFYDGKCGLCSKEITYYRRIAPDGIFNWLDIAHDPTPLSQYHISQSDALRRLHVRDASGGWHIGADAFLVIWRQLNYWRLLAMLVSLPVVKQIARLCYNWFADYRFKRLAHCQIAVNNTTPKNRVIK